MPTNIALKIAILQSGLNGLEIAAAAKMNPAQLSHIVRGARPGYKWQRAIARILKRDPAELFTTPRSPNDRRPDAPARAARREDTPRRDHAGNGHHRRRVPGA